ncbi:MAG: cbb3-type cytochrome c oxidase subunit I [Thermoleophilia bacterium]
MTGGASTRALHPQAEESPVAAKAANRTVAVLAVLAGLALFGVLVIVGVLMRFAQSGTLGISPAWFYRLMTLHGAGMITAALLSMMGALWFVLRTDVALNAPRMWASFLAMVIGAVSVLIATMLGRFAAGWTFLWPLPYDAVGQWSRWATILFLIGVLLVGVGFCIFCIDVLEKTTIAFGGLDRTLGITYLRGRDRIRRRRRQPVRWWLRWRGSRRRPGARPSSRACLSTATTQVPESMRFGRRTSRTSSGTPPPASSFTSPLASCTSCCRCTGRRWKTSAPLVVGWLHAGVRPDGLLAPSLHGHGATQGP